MRKLSKDEINLLRCHARSVVRELGLLNDAYFDIGVTLAERHLLIELSSCLYPTVGEIAERLLLDKSTASRLIAKAVKKGYVNCAGDENDKRKRFLQLTEKGRETLHAFEPIAFNQTEEALLTLTDEEISMVYRGVALYAKGLKQSRLRSKIAMARMKPQDNIGLAHLLAEVRGQEDHNSHIFESYQGKGSAYFVMKMSSKIIGGAGISPYSSDEKGSCQLEKICLHSDVSEVGFEKLLIDFCLKEAKKLGYKQLYIEVDKENLFPISFFQEIGFQLLKKNQSKAALLWKVC